MSRLKNIQENELRNNFEEILRDEEFLNDEDQFDECYFCEESNIDIIKMEYCKLDNLMKMKVKKIIKDIKYHEIISLEICNECGEILRITREMGEKLYNIKSGWIKTQPLNVFKIPVVKNNNKKEMIIPQKIIANIFLLNFSSLQKTTVIKNPRLKNKSSIILNFLIKFLHIIKS